MSEEDFKRAMYEVFETFPSGALAKLCARLSSWDHAKFVAAAGDRQTRIIMHKGDVVWPNRQQRMGPPPQAVSALARSVD